MHTHQCIKAHSSRSNFFCLPQKELAITLSLTNESFSQVYLLTLRDNLECFCPFCSSSNHSNPFLQLPLFPHLSNHHHKLIAYLSLASSVHYISFASSIHYISLAPYVHFLNLASYVHYLSLASSIHCLSLASSIENFIFFPSFFVNYFRPWTSSVIVVSCDETLLWEREKCWLISSRTTFLVVVVVGKEFLRQIVILRTYLGATHILWQGGGIGTYMLNDLNFVPNSLLFWYLLGRPVVFASYSY